MTKPRQTVGLAIIAKNEAEALPRLLASIEGAFDRVVLLDTGSTDKTISVFAAWARKQSELTFSTGRFTWVDDFSVARIAADQLLMFGKVDPPATAREPLVDWTCWADCDDTIVNPEQLREMANDARPEVRAFIFGYDYAQHPATGRTMCHLRRERLVRAGAGSWVGRVHEAQTVDGQSSMVPDAVCHWKHHKQAQGDDAMGASNERNLKILHAWVEDEPDDPRVVGYLGTEHAVRGELAEAVVFFERYMGLKTGWDEERAQMCRKLASAYLHVERIADAESVALQALALLPSWPDTYLTLAEVALTRGEAPKAIFHAERALQLGVPQSLLIINPFDYVCHPHRLIGAARATMRDWDGAVEAGDRALAFDPADVALRAGVNQWRAEAKREHTAQTYILAARQLVAHDEQGKALTLLEDCVPVFAQDHEHVVQLRSQVRERLLWTRRAEDFAEHYETGGSKPEDFIADDQIAPLCEALPRVGFLVAGLQEQMAA